MKKERLSQRVMRGGIWIFGLRISEQVLNLTKIIILARILSPHDFGLMGIALLTMAILETFSKTGFYDALIQKKTEIESYLDTAWTILILRGLLLFAILYLLAPYAALFFQEPQAKSIIQVIGLSILIKSFNNIGIVYFKKELEFNKRFFYQLYGTLTNFIVTVSAALLLRNTWALVFGLLAGDLSRLIAGYFIHPYRPRIVLNLAKAKDLFHFGKWMLGSHIMNFLFMQGDDILVGKFLGATMLGFYGIAYRISNIPATEISNMISTATFPAYSKLQDDFSRLREGYLKVLKVNSFLSFPMAGLIFILAPDFTRIFLENKWMPIIPTLQVLVLWGLLRSFAATTSSLLQAIGRPELVTKVQSVKIITLAIIIYPLTINWGIVGTAWAVVISAVVTSPILIYLAKRVIGFRIAEFTRVLTTPLLAGIIMVGTLSFLKSIIFPDVGVWGLLLLCFSGLIVYIGTIKIINPAAIQICLEVLKSKFR